MALETHTISSIKNNAKIIKQSLKRLGTEISHSHALEVASNLAGYKDWNTASAQISRNTLVALETYITDNSKNDQRTDDFDASVKANNLAHLSPLKRLTHLEDRFTELGYPELTLACKSIVGSGPNGSEIYKSIHEDNMKESVGTWKIVWLKDKITILENIELFQEECIRHGFNPDRFIQELSDEAIKIEDFLQG
jgi:hypothetical protein